MDEWKPIKTHPHTSEDVLVYCKDTGEQFVAYWGDDEPHWIYARGEMFGTIICQPSHWRPLPSPPSR